MTEFGDWFRNKYGADFPVSLDVALVKQDAQVWISENLVGRIQFPPMVPEFRSEPEYVIAGEWGRGVNSYAFYLVEQRGAHRRFFRIFSGGAYGRQEDDSRAVVEYLAGYQRWRRFEPTLEASTLVCNMGDSSAELVSSTGARLSFAAGDEGAAWWNALEERMP
jgi:hypothetical protein